MKPTQPDIHRLARFLLAIRILLADYFLCFGIVMRDLPGILIGLVFAGLAACDYLGPDRIRVFVIKTLVSSARRLLALAARTATGNVPVVLSEATILPSHAPQGLSANCQSGSDAKTDAGVTLCELLSILDGAKKRSVVLRIKGYEIKATRISHAEELAEYYGLSEGMTPPLRAWIRKPEPVS